ncbi:MAG: site-specific integrase [Desulfosarcina sp.]|nr:site-specific integrase [Desulfosarcina sp.]MBC2744504.1 site-specific integrase [Desulfosarcina sp.]MBC2767414.1 tyrosine-type recombinase/integrase [Desulfosarcina sp.]
MSTLLRNRFEDYMTLRGFSPKTKQAYVGAVAGLAGYYRKTPDNLDNKQIQAYLLHLIKERGLAWSSCNVVFSGLRCFYGHVLNWENTRFSIPSRPRQKKLPLVMSVEDVMRLIDATKSPKNRVLLMTVYGGGLRVGEVVRLKAGHIESERMLIRVEQGKGRKDRYTLLPRRLLTELRAYYAAYRPGEWLFFSKIKSKPMPIGTAQKVYYWAKKRAGITRGKGIHTLRHCFATHLMDQGVDLYVIKQMMGHSAIKTTSRYLHASNQKLAKLISPLDLSEFTKAGA